MAGSVDRELYDRLLVAYREGPGRHVWASREAGCSTDTARKLWDRGSAKLNLRAISDVLEEEQLLARAERERRERELEREREELKLREKEALVRARADAIEARAEEAVASKSARKNALALMGTSARLLQVTARLADELKRRTETAEQLGKMDLTAIRQLLQLSGSVTERALRVGRMALEIERLVVGEIQSQLEEAPSTPEELAGEIERIASVVERARGRVGLFGIPNLDEKNEPS